MLPLQVFPADWRLTSMGMPSASWSISVSATWISTFSPLSSITVAPASWGDTVWPVSTLILVIMPAIGEVTVQSSYFFLAMSRAALALSICALAES